MRDAQVIPVPGLTRDLSRQLCVSLIISLVFFFSSSSVAISDYFRTSSVEATICRGWLIERCEIVAVGAISEGSTGQLFEMAEEFGRVSDFNSATSRCWLNNERVGYFAHVRQEDDSFVVLGQPDSFTFNCVQTD